MYPEEKNPVAQLVGLKPGSQSSTLTTLPLSKTLAWWL